MYLCFYDKKKFNLAPSISEFIGHKIFVTEPIEAGLYVRYNSIILKGLYLISGFENFDKNKGYY